MGNNYIMRKVSVLMSTYNRVNLLPEAVESFFNQIGDIDSELIILNNGSTDLTAKYLETLRKKENIRIYTSQKNRPLDAGNYLWSQAKGEYVCVLCDDDQLTSSSLWYRVKAMEIHSADVCYGNVIIQNISGETKNLFPAYPVDKERILNDEYINFTALMWRKDINKKFVFDTDLIYYQDWFFKIRCLQECKVIAVQSEVMRYTIHSGQESARLRGTGQKENIIMRNKIKSLYDK